MRDLSVEVKVGMAVVAAAVILVFGVVWLKEYRFDVKHYRIECLFPQVGSLSVGDPVRVLGVQKGEVKKVEVVGNNVKVVLALESDIKLKEDARFVVMNVGLMGERFIAVWPGGSNSPLDLSRPAYGHYDTGVPEIMGMMGEAIDQLKRLVYDMEGIVGQPGKGDQIKLVITRLDKITQAMEQMVTENQTNLEAAVKDFGRAAAQMRSLLDSNAAALQTTFDNLAQSSDIAVTTLAKVDSLSAELRSLAQRLDDGTGTMGKLLADDSLYYDLRRALANLDSLVTDFKAHPKKYIRVSLF